jgi:hypothetical protein
MRGDEVPDVDPIYDGEAAPTTGDHLDHVDDGATVANPMPTTDPVTMSSPVPTTRVPLGGPTRESLAPDGYQEVDDEDEGGEDAWSLTRNGQRDDL